MCISVKQLFSGWYITTMSLKTANSGFWEWPKHFPGWLAGDVGVSLNVPAPNPRGGSQVKSSTLFSLLWQFWNLYITCKLPICFENRKESHSIFSHFFSSFCKTIVILSHFFFFFSCNICSLLQFFFLYLRVISCFIWLFLPNALSKYLLCPSRYAITRYGLGWLYFFAVKSNIQFSNFISALNYVTWNEC